MTSLTRNCRLQQGDLELLDIVEHIDDAKRYALVGHFKGDKAEHILARIGEGEKDERSAETIRITAERLADTLKSLYASDAMARAMKLREERRPGA